MSFEVGGAADGRSSVASYIVIGCVMQGFFPPQITQVTSDEDTIYCHVNGDHFTPHNHIGANKLKLEIFV